MKVNKEELQEKVAECTVFSQYSTSIASVFGHEVVYGCSNVAKLFEK